MGHFDLDDVYFQLLGDDADVDRLRVRRLPAGLGGRRRTDDLDGDHGAGALLPLAELLSDLLIVFALLGEQPGIHLIDDLACILAFEVANEQPGLAASALVGHFQAPLPHHEIEPAAPILEGREAVLPER